MNNEYVSYNLDWRKPRQWRKRKPGERVEISPLLWGFWLGDGAGRNAASAPCAESRSGIGKSARHHDKKAKNHAIHVCNEHLLIYCYMWFAHIVSTIINTFRYHNQVVWLFGCVPFGKFLGGVFPPLLCRVYTSRDYHRATYRFWPNWKFVKWKGRSY
jgi:hypothetical protein